MKDRALIIDLDGTLTNCEHRVHFVKQSPKDWKSFNKEMINDSLNTWCRELIVTFRSGGYNILFVTGRDDSFRGVTISWLEKHKIEYDHLYMRQAGNIREDFEVKKEIYFSEIKDKYDTLFVVDDRKSVVNMWREIGLTCLQCADGDF